MKSIKCSGHPSRQQMMAEKTELQNVLHQQRERRMQLEKDCRHHLDSITQLKHEHRIEIETQAKKYSEKCREAEHLAIHVSTLERERRILFAALEKTSR